MKLRCRLLSFLKLHQPDCDLCKARETCGLDMRRRLEELNSRTLPNSRRREARGEVAAVVARKPLEVIQNSAGSLAREVKKAG